MQKKSYLCSGIVKVCYAIFDKRGFFAEVISDHTKL